MFSDLRQKGASSLAYGMFGLLIIIFIINIGPQGGAGGCGGTSAADSRITVRGERASQAAFRWATFWKGADDEVEAPFLLDQMLTTELLAQAGSAAGFVVGDKLVYDRIKAGRLFISGADIDMRNYYLEKVGDEYFFNDKIFARFIDQFGLRVTAFKKQQAREILAGLFAASLAQSAVASKEEAKAEYIYQNDLVEVDFVKFLSSEYGEKLLLTEADIAGYATAAESVLRAEFNANEAKWKGRPKEVRIRHILIAKAQPDDGSDDEKDVAIAAAKAAADVKNAALKAKLVAARQQIAAGASFASQAVLATDARRAKLGGLVGWERADAPLAYDPALSGAVKALSKGAISDVIETAEGYSLVMIDDEREGDIAFEGARFELAQTHARKTWGRQAAQRAATVALAKAKAAGKPIRDLWEPDAASRTPRFDADQMRQLQELMQNPNMTPEQKEDFLRQISRAETLGPIEMAASGASDTAEEKPAAPPAEPPPPLPTSVEIDLSAIRVRNTSLNRPFDGALVNVGKSVDLTTELFDRLTDGTLVDRPFEIAEPEGYVVAQLVSHKAPDLAAFEKEADARVADLRRSRGQRLVLQWLRAECTRAADKIKPNKNYLRETDENGKVLNIAYTPCAEVGAAFKSSR